MFCANPQETMIVLLRVFSLIFLCAPFDQYVLAELSGHSGTSQGGFAERRPGARSLRPACCLAQPEADGQNGLGGHGSSFGGSGAEPRKQDRFPGGLIHSEASTLQDFHLVYRPSFIQRKLQDHDSLFSQASGLARVPGLGHADNTRPPGRSESYQAARRTGTDGSVAAGAWSGSPGRSVAGCAGAAPRALRMTRSCGLKLRCCGLSLAIVRKTLSGCRDMLCRGGACCLWPVRLQDFRFWA
jgi:hypothetical protein